MRKYSILGATLFICGVLSTPLAAKEQSSDFACEVYQRPNVDCACVEQRMQVYVSNTQSAAVKKLLTQRYAHALGLDNDLEGAFESLMSNPSTMITAQMGFGNLGGLPENIEDFERGCHVETSQVFDIPDLVPGSVVAEFADSRIKILGQNHKRDQFCIANRMSEYMTEAELKAYHLSFSHYEGDHLNDDTTSRAKKMGVTRAQYQQFERSGRAKFEQNSQRDTNYCNAITYAELFSTERIKEDKAREAARFQITQKVSELAKVNTDKFDDRNKAEYLMQTSCVQQGKSKSYCQCVMNDFDKKVAQRAQRPGVVLAWVLMRNGAEMDSQELMQLTQQSNRQDQQQAAQLFITTLDVGESCVEERSSDNIELAGDPRVRMMRLCIEDMEDEGVCNCLVDKMQSKLNSDDFEFVVDIRHADSQGSDDPLATVAEDRGLTREQAEQALGTNKSLIGGMMNMDLLSCVGNMSDPSQFPRFIGQ